MLFLIFRLFSAPLVSSTNNEKKKDSSQKKSISVLCAGEERAVSLTIFILPIFPVYSGCFRVGQIQTPAPLVLPFSGSFPVPCESVSGCWPSAPLRTQLERSALINLCLHLKSHLRWCRACLCAYLQSRLTAQTHVPLSTAGTSHTSCSCTGGNKGWTCSKH